MKYLKYALIVLLFSSSLLSCLFEEENNFKPFIKIENESSYTVNAVYIAEAGSSEKTELGSVSPYTTKEFEIDKECDREFDVSMEVPNHPNTAETSGGTPTGNWSYEEMYIRSDAWVYITIDDSLIYTTIMTEKGDE